MATVREGIAARVYASPGPREAPLVDKGVAFLEVPLIDLYQRQLEAQPISAQLYKHSRKQAIHSAALHRPICRSESDVPT